MIYACSMGRMSAILWRHRINLISVHVFANFIVYSQIQSYTLWYQQFLLKHPTLIMCPILTQPSWTRIYNQVYINNMSEKKQNKNMKLIWFNNENFGFWQSWILHSCHRLNLVEEFFQAQTTPKHNSIAKIFTQSCHVRIVVFIFLRSYM